MPNNSIDAIKVAKAIQKDDLSILRGKEFKMRDKIKKNKDWSNTVGKPKEEKMTLVKLAKEMRDGFKQVNSRIDNLEKDINTRIDYIVKANDLKDSK